MKPEQIFEALSFVDEELLLQSENGKGDPDEALPEAGIPAEAEIPATTELTGAERPEEEAGLQKKAPGKIIHWRRWTAMAACLLIALLSLSQVRLFMCGSSSSSSSSCEEYDQMAAAEDSGDDSADTAEAAGEETADSAENSAEGSAENSADSSYVTGNSLGEEAYWVTSEGVDYVELTVEDAEDYGLTEEDLIDIPEDDLGDSVGTVEDASDDSLIGETIYQSKTCDELFIVETGDGYRYFYQ